MSEQASGECPHGAAVCEDCAYDRGFAEGRRDAQAQIDRLDAVLRQTHVNYCIEAYTSRGLHAPECLLLALYLGVGDGVLERDQHGALVWVAPHAFEGMCGGGFGVLGACEWHQCCPLSKDEHARCFPGLAS